MSHASKMGIPDWEFHAVFGGSVEFDPAKNESNLKKHGCSLHYGAELLSACFGLFSRRRICTSDSFLENEEVRHMHLVEDGGAIFMIVTTMRGDGVIRVISLRRASQQERQKFAEVTSLRGRSGQARP